SSDLTPVVVRGVLRSRRTSYMRRGNLPKAGESTCAPDGAYRFGQSQDTPLSSLFRVAVRNLFPRLSRERRSMTARSKSDQFVPHILKLSHDDRPSQTADRSDDQRCKRIPPPESTSHMSARTTVMRAPAFPDVSKSLPDWIAH